MASPAVPRTPPPLGVGPLALPRPPGMLSFPGFPAFNPMSTSNDEDLNGADMDSDMGSENEDSINEIDSERLDASHREILEKLKRQEQEEREEIERELREAQKEAFLRARQHEELRAQELRAQEMKLQEDKEKDCGLRDTEPTQTEIKTQRPLGLLAQHGMHISKAHSHILEKEREKDMIMKDREITEPEKNNDQIPPPIDFSTHHNAYLEARSPPFPNSPSTTHSPSDLLSSQQGHHWTFEEQFKQLYEISDDLKRREFLDDLFSFMQKRGTPVNRIPIMAKRVLDLYELFRLVVAKGGLVEVINKKLWREITKELNLPSSITSAAFTLRTQYMKYIYPYECEKLKLSSPGELQAAIDGNRREGRRPSYGYDFSPVPTMIPTPPGPHMNGSMFNGRPNTGSCSPEEGRLPSPPAHPLRTLAERDARAMEAAQRAMENATKRFEEASRAGVGMMPTLPTSAMTSLKTEEPLPPKRPALDEQRLLAHMGMPNAHLKITSRSDGRSEFDNSLVVSMEINGIMYQGVLFAQHPRRI